MAPTRIIFIRHAEKPGFNNQDDGIDPDGSPDVESLTVRGWQRAGALARYFSPATGAGELTPSTVFAAGIGHGSKSRRPIQTVTPLVDLLKATRQVAFVTEHLKDHVEAVMQDALQREGIVLISWEHKRIPDLVAELPGAPAVPDWPDDRFDIAWVLDRTLQGWMFRQVPQLVLSGDSSEPVL
jgi:broad specificity phosphatase PhoE